MPSPRRSFLNELPTPAPRPFHADKDLPNRRVEIMGHAVDDVVGSFVEVVVGGDSDASDADVLRLAAAAHRLWKLASDHRRARWTP